MYTTTDDNPPQPPLGGDKGGVYATEPTIYYAEYPSPEQQRRYAIQGAVATLFVTAVILVSLAVS